MTIRLINCFEVPDGQDEQFMARFLVVNAFMAAQPGYLGHRLHRALVPAARYRYVNYVEWQSVEHLAAARGDTYRELAGAVLALGVTSEASIYEVVHERSADTAMADT